MIQNVEMTSDGMITPSFMTIDSGIQVTLKVLPQQLERLYSIGITDEREFLSTPLRWPQWRNTYIVNFMKTGSAIQTLIGLTNTHTYTQQGDLTSLLLFFQNKGSRIRRW
jgi:hypothetical protein